MFFCWRVAVSALIAIWWRLRKVTHYYLMRQRRNHRNHRNLHSLTETRHHLQFLGLVSKKSKTHKNHRKHWKCQQLIAFRYTRKYLLRHSNAWHHEAIQFIYQHRTILERTQGQNRTDIYPPQAQFRRVVKPGRKVWSQNESARKTHFYDASIVP